MRLIGEITGGEIIANRISNNVELLKYCKDKFDIDMFNENNLIFHIDNQREVYMLYRQSWEDV